MEINFDDAFESLNALSLETATYAFKTVTVEHGIQLQVAPNEIMFIEHQDFLGFPKFFPYQYQVVRDFFELLCPNCNNMEEVVKTDEEALTDEKYKDDRSLYDKIREQQVLFEYDYCPVCGAYKYDFPYGSWKHPNELVVLLGRRSGKTAISAAVALTKVYQFLLTPNLQERLGIVKNKQLSGLFAATTGDQTASTIFGDVVNYFNNSSWYQKLKKELIFLEKKHGKKKGTYYSEDRKGIYLSYKNINLKSLHSNSASIKGDTAIIGALDELANFDDTASKRSANEMYSAIKYSLQTVISSTLRKREKQDYSIPDALMIDASTPMTPEDKIMSLYKESLVNKRMIGIKRASWEANPVIKLKDLEEEYRQDPIAAERDYGVNPPESGSPFIANPALVDICAGDYNSIVAYKDKFFTITSHDNSGNIINSNYVSLELLATHHRNTISYVMHCDCGKNHDSFGMAIGHLEGNVVIIDAIVEARPLTKINPYKLPPHSVNFKSLMSFIALIANKMNIKLVTFDQWNSASYIDELISKGISAIGQNLDREDHCRFRESIETSTIRFPKKENDTLDPRINRNMPCSKALLEIKQLEDNGKKVDHPKTGSNDVAQCCVGVHRILRTPEKLNINKIKSFAPFRGYSKKSSGKVVKLKRFI